MVLQISNICLTGHHVFCGDFGEQVDYLYNQEMRLHFSGGQQVSNIFCVM